jgi:outer membrane protein
MKNGLIVVNVLLILAVVFLFYKLYHPSGNHVGSAVSTADHPQASTDGSGCRIAYFIMDSIENTCDMVKDVKNELNKKETSSMTELSRMDQQMRDKAADYQNKANSNNMSQAEGEQAQQDIMQRQQKIHDRKQVLDQEYQNLYVRLNTDMKKKIEDFLKEYNKSKNYSYIFAYDNGLFFYKDSAFNITGEVVNGLNNMYSKQKKN